MATRPNPAGEKRSRSNDADTITTTPFPSPPPGSGRGGLVGQVLGGRYRLVSYLGRGGMAEVYRATHTTVGRSVAVKVLRPEQTRDEEYVRRFLQEARAVGRISHHNVVSVLDWGATAEGYVYSVMEYLDGETLAAVLAREGSLPWERARRIILQIGRAVAAAHAEGVIHRDLKPENCFLLTRSGEHGNGEFVKVIDFGIAKVRRSDFTTDRPETLRGTIMGTVDYISPEQAKGVEVDARADIYGMGVILFEMLTGQVPFSGETSMEVLAQHICLPPPRPSEVAPLARIPPEVDVIVLRALEKRPEDRWGSAAEMVAAIEAVGERFSADAAHGRRWGPSVAVAVVALMLATGS